MSIRQGILLLTASIAFIVYAISSAAASDDRMMTQAERAAGYIQPVKVRTASLHPNKRHARKAQPQEQAPEMPSAHTPIIAEARKYLGSGPVFGRKTLWCGNFMDYVLRKTGHKPGSNLAASYASYGRRISGPQVGAIAVMKRGKRGGHVGVVSGVLQDGSIRVISGNHNNRVAESVYPRGRAYAFVVPN